MSYPDYSEPLQRTSRYHVPVVGGTCALRLRKRNDYHFKAFNVVLVNESPDATSVLFREVSDYHQAADRTDVGSQIDLKPGAQVIIDLSHSKRYLELWGVNTAAYLRVEIKSRIRWDLVPFDRFDQTDSNLLWRPVMADEPVTIQYQPEPILVWTGSSLDFKLDRNVFFDASGRGLTFSVTAPDWLEVDGLRIYGTPTSAHVGKFDIVLVATDHRGRTATVKQVVEVRYTNLPPAAIAAVEDVQVQVQSALSLSLDYESLFADDPADTLTFSVSGLPSWATEEDGLISGVPELSDEGSVSTVGITATDQGNLSTTIHFSIAVVNNPPVIGDQIPDQTVVAGEDFDFTLPDTAIVDTDPLIFEASGLPDWLEFNSVTRKFLGTPDLTDLGTVTITVRATDTLGHSVEASFDITVIEP